jgi:hypothetical protein
VNDYKDRIVKLEEFVRLLDLWQKSGDDDVRAEINRRKAAVQREVLEAGQLKRITLSPPPAVGGLVMQNINPFDMIFDAPYLHSFIPTVRDMIHETIGALESESDTGHSQLQEERAPNVHQEVRAGYVFVAMPIAPGDFDDVLDSIKEACQRCGLTAERIDEAQSNERITDRILESISKAQFVIADLTDSRPNVFYEAGYAHGIGKLPIYIAREGTKLEFDLKDYPVIFFSTYRQLKDALEKRLRAIGDQ